MTEGRVTDYDRVAGHYRRTAQLGRNRASDQQQHHDRHLTAAERHHRRVFDEDATLRLPGVVVDEQAVDGPANYPQGAPG